jgi:threonine dehydrogenase-like Zn-dependent dehydrogenase
MNKNIPLKKIITHRYPLTEAEKAFNQFSAGGTGKVIFEW